MPRHTPRSVAGASVLVLAGLALTGPLTAAPAQAAAPPRAVSVFPNDDLTVRDARQLTGRRVALPSAGCTTVTVCGLAQRVNQLDGFDLDPRLAVRFDRAVDPVSVAGALTVQAVRGGGRDRPIGVDRVVYDAATHTVYAHPRSQLDPGTTYRTVLDRRDLPRVRSTFTTASMTDGLLDLRRQLDSGRAYSAAGIDRGERGLQVDAVVPAAGTTLTYVQDRGRTGGLVPTPVPDVAAPTAASYVFGSYLAPTWLRADRTIEQTPTRDRGPQAQGAQRLPFVLIVPAGQAPRGGWPVAAFGHGFTRSDADVFLAAATNAGQGLATIATDVVGHGYGPRSSWQVRTADGAVRSLPAYGRGVDLERDGVIGSTEGSSPLPSSPAAAIGSRDALRQTVLDVSALLRAVGGPAGVPADVAVLRADRTSYYGQSFGGIYGTMLAAVEPDVRRSVLNVAGGPVTEIVRLAPGFRPLTTQALSFAGLLNGGDVGFTESMPLRGEAPVLAPAPGSLAIQDYLAASTWLTRSGSPEAFAPLVDDRRSLFQVARGDQTVPNPTSYALLDAGGLFGRASLYRNDLSTRAASNPHGFLLDPSFGQGFLPGQRQISTFLTTGAVIDPDAAGPVWEVPVRDPGSLRTLAFAPAAPTPTG